MTNLKSIETMEGNDADLVAQSLAGDREAYGHIVGRYQSLICSLNYSATGNLSQSEDLAQETFITAWKDLARLREPTKLRSWLCRIARNLTCDSLRREGREPSHAAELLEAAAEAPAPEPWPVDRAISREEQALLWQSIERIPEIYREPLVLFYREQQSIQTVAQHLELSEDAVKQRLSRGRKMLQEQLVAFVEGALERTNPGKVFTIAVISALPAMTFSAKAATLGAAAAKGSGAAKTAAIAGFLGAVFSPLLIFFGNYAGYRMSLAAAHTEEERGRIKKIYRHILVFTLVCSLVFAGLAFWACAGAQDHLLPFEVSIVGFIVIFSITLGAFIVGTMRARRRFLAALQASGEAGTDSPAAFEYRTAATLLGMPLIHIRLGDRFAPLKKPVTAWIAAGDSARGGLFAFGGIAVAPICIGGCAIGLLPFGGLTFGLLALGGLALGVFSYGGFAIGYQAFGGCALGWNSAAGGIAFAKYFALGGAARAADVNDNAAHRFIESQPFFHYGEIVSHHFFWMHLLWVVPMILQWRLIARNRAQRETAGHRERSR